nr:hypothetical protein [Mucilaginibacter sp. L294]
MAIESEIDHIESFYQINSFINYFSNAAVNIKVYVDSSDVLTMLNGLDAMRGNAFQLNREEYDSEYTLIYSLIYGNWLGSVHLLIPHQEELLHNLKHAPSLQSLDDLIEEFQSIVIEETMGMKLLDLENESIETTLQKLAPIAADLYKANYLLCELNWRERFRKLIHEKRLLFDKNKDDLVEIVNSDLFKKIHHGFKKKRQNNNSKRNLSDAMALCILQKRVQSFKDGLTKELPVFFGNFFDEIIENTGTSEYFTVMLSESGAGKEQIKPFKIIIGNQFIKYYALNRNLRTIEFSLKDIHANNLLSEYKELSAGISKDTGKILGEYSQSIVKFTESRFLQVCWVNSTEDTAELISRLVNVKKLRTKEYQEKLNEDVNVLMSSLNNSTVDWSIFKDIFDSISTSNKQINEIFNNNLNNLHARGHFDVMSELSLIRFSIEEQYIKKTNDVINTLLFPGDQSKAFVIKNVADEVLSVLHEEKSKRSIIVPVLVLWVIEEYRLIDKIFNALNREYPHFSEGFVHAAAIAKIMNDTTDKPRITNILNEINGVEMWSFEINYRTAIAASYVYFHLWKKRYSRHFFATSKEPKLSPHDEVNKLLDQAIAYADLAIGWLEDADFEKSKDKYQRAKYYYILNCRIYYLTMGGENKRFFKLRDDVGLLQDCETNHPEIWEYRYYDTLALFHLRRGLIAKEIKNQSAFELNIEQAKVEIQKGLELVINREDQNLFDRLKNQIFDQSFDL